MEGPVWTIQMVGRGVLTYGFGGGEKQRLRLLYYRRINDLEQNGLEGDRNL